MKAKVKVKSLLTNSLAVICSATMVASMTPNAALAEVLNAAEAEQTDCEFLTTDNIASGTCDSCTWVIDSEGTLTVAPTDGESGTLDTWDFVDLAPWCSYGSKIKSARFEGEVKAKTCNLMFYECSSLTSLDLSGLDTSLVTDMRRMLEDCSSLTSLNLSGLDTSSATKMGDMFNGCSSLTSLDLSGLDTSSVTDMSYMFYGCSSLTSLDLSSLDASSVTSMSSMCYGCSSLTEIDLPATLDCAKAGMQNAFKNIHTGSKVVVQTDAQYEALYGNDNILSPARTTLIMAGSQPVVKKSIAGATATGVPSTAPYTGAQVSPSPTITLDGETLTEGKDYLLVYSNNTSPGTAAIVALGIGNYDGYLYITFEIAIVEPSITMQPSDVAAGAGGNVTLHIETSQAAASYQWQHSKDGLTWSDTTWTGCDTDTLSFKMLKSLDGRYWRCIVSFADGSTVVSDQAQTLLSAKSGVITSQPADCAVPVGSLATFAIETSGEVSSYQWQHSKDGTSWSNTKWEGFNTNTLAFKMLSSLDERLWRCVVTFADGTVEVSENVASRILSGSGDIAVQPSDQQAAAGEQVTFQVTATGKVVSYRWQHSRDGLSWSSTSWAGYNTPTMSFKMLNSLDGRYWRCVVTFGDGSFLTTDAVQSILVA